MGVWLQRNGPAGNFYLRSCYGGEKTFRNLHTADPDVAQAELLRARAEFTRCPSASGNIRWTPEQYEQFGDLPGKSRVQKQNYACAARAIGLLGEDPKFDWLLKPTPKTTILAQLGRVEEEHRLLLIAEAVCLQRPRTLKAVKAIRVMRGRGRKLRKPALWEVIRTAIQKHLAQYPAEPVRPVAALEAVLAGYRIEEKLAA